MSDDIDLSTRVQRWLQEIELVDIVILRLEGHRNHEATDQEINEFEGGYDPNFSVELDETDNERIVRVRVALGIELPFGRILAEVGMVYQSEQREFTKMAQDEITMFVNDVALMAAFPYLRSEVGHIALKLFKTALVFPIIRRGEVVFRPVS